MSKTSKKGWAIAAAIAGVVAVAGIILALRGNEPPSTAKPGGATDKPAEPSEGLAKPELKPGNPPGCEEMPSSITIAPCLPSDVLDGASNATLSTAAIFAWQELIALNWPAVEQTGKPNTRGVADPSARLEAINPDTARLPTWVTFRHKSEIFPGDGNQPHGNGTPGEGLYDDLPKYIYKPDAVGTGYVEDNVPLTAGQIPACVDGPVANNKPEYEAFITADEVSQIGQDFMFAGRAGQKDFDNTPGNPDTREQILFLVKANRTYFDYIVPSQPRPEPWWQGIPKDVRYATQGYLYQHHADPPPGSRDLVSFPNGTIMVKSAWRRAGAPDLESGRYLIQSVRYYEHQKPSLTYGGKPGNPEHFCYATGSYALVGLHIIQKTPTAPYFIYASFEHADNLLTSDGRPIEDENGMVIVAHEPPLTPKITAKNATPTAHQSFEPKEADCSPGSSLYYENDAHMGSSIVTQGVVCVRGRLHPIPPEIIEANRTAHAAIEAYASTGGPHAPSVLKYYKLINVQTKPFDKKAGKDYVQESGGPDPSTFYMANIVVETNYPLQVFSGTFAIVGDVVGTGPDTGIGDGTITDYDYAHILDGKGIPFKNIQYGGHEYNMGGCMGCHGVAQSRGGGFSFMLDGIKPDGLNLMPEVASGPNNIPTSFAQRYHRFLGRR